MAVGPPELSDLELDLSSYQLRGGQRVLRLEKIPMELLILLAEKKGQLVGREEIIQRLWGKDVFLDTEQGINTAIRKIRQVLGDDPEQPRFVQTVVGKGYRFVGPITIRRAPEQMGNKETTKSATGEQTEERTREKRAIGLDPRWLIAVGLTMVVLITFAFFSLRHYTAVSPRPDKVMLVVLPFENLSGDPQREYFSDGLTEEMITQLGQLNPRQLGVIARTSAMQYKNSKKDVAEIAKELNVDYILEGSARGDGSNVRVTTQLIQVKDRTHLWAHSYDGKLQDVLGLQREIAATVGNEIRIVITAQEKLSPKPRLVNPEAYDLYLKGQYFWAQMTEASLKKALEYFQQAAEKDPTYAPSQAGIALSYNMLEYQNFISPRVAYPNSLAATKRALELDPLCPEAHLALTYIKNHYEWNWTEAEIEAKRTIELNPNYALAYQWYSYHLRETGRMKQSVNEMTHALELDPVSELFNIIMAGRLMSAQQYPDALIQLRNIEDLGFQSSEVFRMRNEAYEKLGRQNQAVEAYEKYLTARGDQDLVDRFRRLFHEHGYVEAKRTVDRSCNNRDLNRLQQRARKGDYVSPGDFAIAYASLGDNQRAYDWLDRAYQEHSSLMIELTFRPVFDSMRSEPQFQNLVKSVGVPQYKE